MSRGAEEYSDFQSLSLSAKSHSQINQKTKSKDEIRQIYQRLEYENESKNKRTKRSKVKSSNDQMINYI